MLPVTRKPAGGVFTVSPWDIHTRESLVRSMPSHRAPGTDKPQVGGAILAGFGLFQPTTEVEGQKLHTVADAEDRHAEVKESLVQRGSVLSPTLAGPPDRMIAEGCMAFTCAAVTTQGWISE